MAYKISIIIPVFNVEDYLEEALESIVNQTIGLENLEVIMVNDCSTDKSGKIMDHYAKNYNNFNAIHLSKNSGFAGKPRNIGMAKASGKYLMFLDPDDYYSKDTCEILYNKISRENVDIVFGTYTIHYKNEKMVMKTGFRGPQVKIETIDKQKRFLKLPPSVWTKIFKRDLIEKNNIIFPEGIPGQDLAFMTHALLKAEGIILINQSVGNYRVRSDENVSVTFNRNYKYMSGLIKAYDYTYQLCKDNNKEEYISFILESHLNFWIKQFILSDLDVSEKKEVLALSHDLFEKYMEYDLNPNPLYLIHIIDKIVKKEYNNAISLSNSVINLIKNQEKEEQAKIKRKRQSKDLFPKIPENSISALSRLKLKNNLIESPEYKISVIIPVYNVEKYIKECLDSIVHQTIGIENIQVIVVNDCTPDNSMDVVREYAMIYPSIQIVEHEKNKGLGPSRNTGLKYVTADYVSFIDSDDLISLNTYEVVLEKIKTFNSELIIFPYQLFNEKGKKYPETIHHGIFKKKGLIENLENTPEIIFATSSCNKIYSKNLIHLMKYPASYYEDNAVSAELSFNAKNIYLTDECAYFYRQRLEEDSITQQVNKKKCFDLIDINIQLHDLKKRYPDYQYLIKWINLHFVDKNILNWTLNWDFSQQELDQIFYTSHIFLKDISQKDINKFNKLFPRYKLLRRKLIYHMIRCDYESFIKEYKLTIHNQNNAELNRIKFRKNFDAQVENNLKSLTKLVKEIKHPISTKKKEQNIKRINNRINNISALFYELEYSNQKRPFIQRLISIFPSLYILLNRKNHGIKNALINIKGYRAIQKNQLFNRGYYLKNNKDVRESGIEPLIHYLFHGYKENRKPSPNFNGKYYLKTHKKVKKAKMNPLIHYALYGKKEGRRTR